MDNKGSTNLCPEDPEDSHDDDEGRHDYINKKRSGDHGVTNLTRRLPYYILVQWLHSETGQRSGERMKHYHTVM